MSEGFPVVVLEVGCTKETAYRILKALNSHGMKDLMKIMQGVSERETDIAMVEAVDLRALGISQGTYGTFKKLFMLKDDIERQLEELNKEESS